MPWSAKYFRNTFKENYPNSPVFPFKNGENYRMHDYLSFNRNLFKTKFAKEMHFMKILNI